MVVWILLLIVFAAGVMGGTVNALLSDNGFVMPVREAGILRPGWVGNALTGGVAASISWSMYGPLGTYSIVGSSGSMPGADLTLSAFGAAILVGVAGARWLTSEVDKSLLRAAGVEVAKQTSSESLVAAMASSTPAAALNAVRTPPPTVTAAPPAAPRR